MRIYDEICKIKDILFYCKSREINLPYVLVNLLCFSKNVYLHNIISGTSCSHKYLQLVGTEIDIFQIHYIM